jgi:hypothetical protein
VKTFRIILFIVYILLLSEYTSRAQVLPAKSGTDATAKVYCTIVSPIGVIKVKDMYFGRLVTGDAGSVQLNPNGDLILTTGGVVIQTTNSFFTAAVFEVNDGLVHDPVTQHFFTGYSISLPSQDATLVDKLGRKIRISNFTSAPSSLGYGNFTNGQGILRVGATLYIEAYQGIGKIVSVAPFPVTVNFY